ncbi:MAG: PLP-dependent aminotransferase family protein [Clostridia bacterium]|nr:PLP-dependent aminotransferase family protein [Clostridia bacterium]
MNYILEKSSSKPIYIQLYEQIKNDIVNSVYPYNTKLPSKRLVSEELQISIVTVEHTYSLLCDEGYVQSRERSGYYVSYVEGDEIVTTSHSCPISSNISIHYDENDFPFSVMAKTMRKVISDYGEHILVKCPNSGCEELRKAIAGYLTRGRGMKLSYEQIIIGSGAEYLYGLIIQALGRERIFAIENPSYEKIDMVYRANGVTIESLTLGADGIKSSELKRSDATVLHISPYRSFPSGVSASASKRREYVRWANGRGGFIIEDDFESEFTVLTKPEETVFALADQENVIYINTFSKTIAPSIRIGYMVIPKSLIELFESKVGFYSCTVPTFEQYVLAEFIRSGDFERHINRVRRKKRKQLL